MRNRSQNVTGEKVRSPKGHKPAPDRQKEAGESPDKKGITVDCHNLWDAPPPEKQGEGRKKRGAVGEGPGGVEAVAAIRDGCKSGRAVLSGRAAWKLPGGGIGCAGAGVVRGWAGWKQ